MADETKNDTSKLGASSEPKDWKLPDPSMPTRQKAVSETAPPSGNQAATEAPEEFEYSRSPMLGVMIAVLFGGVLLIGAAVGYYYYKRSRQQAENALSMPATHWISGENAEKRFQQEWAKARVIDSPGFAEFAQTYWSLQEAYQNKPYDKKFENIEDQKTKIFKDFVKDDLMAVEVPFPQFYSGEKSASTERYQLQLSRSENQMGDGGYRILRSLVSFKLPTEMLEFRLTPILEQKQVLPEAVRVRGLFSVYHAEASADVQQVRPLDLPAGAKRFNALNRFVLMTKADVVLSADLMGIAIVKSDGTVLQTVMKGHPEAAK